MRTFILLAAVLLAGCIKLDMTQTIDSKGNVAYSITYDFTKMAEMADSVSSSLEEGSSASSSEMPKDNCASFMEEQKKEPNKNLKNATCVDVAPHIITLTGTAKLSPRQLIRRRSTSAITYLYRIDSILKFVSPDWKPESEQSSSSSVSPGTERLSKEIMDSIIEGNVTVTMPGRITQSAVGTITGNSSVVIPWSEMLSKPRGYIRSKEDLR